MEGLLQTNVDDLQGQALHTLGLIDQHEEEVRELSRKITNLKTYHTDLTRIIEFAEQLLASESPQPSHKTTEGRALETANGRHKRSRKIPNRISKKAWDRLVRALPSGPEDGLNLKQVWQLARRKKILVTQHAVYMRLVRFEEEGRVSRTLQPKKQRWFQIPNNVINLQTTRK